MDKKFTSHLDLAKSYWTALLKPGDWVIDATLGNGHDSLFLAEMGANVVGLDIQLQALEKSKNLLTGKQIDLRLMSHAELDQLNLPCRPKLIVYNLGYLPGGDKSVTTRLETTLRSVSQAIELTEAALSIMCYPGHAEGEKEEAALAEWASHLPKDRWDVAHHRWTHRPRSPSLLWISSHRP
ncbi:MAG: class I SAM-dependent methyltransferase [Verrucomicrobia bacterium]|nr:class I SAM-dependent methyltransferase [Verrucomicrobiota bacterium]